MNLILRWLLGQMGELCSQCFSMIAALSLDGFSNPVVKSLLSLFHMIGLPFFGVALLILLMKAMLDLGDNKTVSFIDMIKRACIGMVIYLFGTDLMKYSYLFILELTNKILGALSSNTSIDPSIWDFAADITGSSLFTTILLLIAAFYMLKNILNLLERFWLLIVSMLMLYIYLPGYVSGNDEGIILWFKTCIGISLTQLLQSIIVTFGMTLFASGGKMTDFGLAIGAIIAASKIDTLMDKWGQSAGSNVGNLARNSMSSVFYAKQLLTKVK